MKNITINTLLIGLFIVGFITFIIQFQEETGTETRIIDNPAISKAFGNISKELNESSANAEAQRQTMIDESSNPVLSLGFFVIRSILNAGAVFMNLIVGIFGYISVLMLETLGIPPIVLGTLSAILIITIVLAVWKLWKVGE